MELPKILARAKTDLSQLDSLCHAPFLVAGLLLLFYYQNFNILQNILDLFLSKEIKKFHVLNTFILLAVLVQHIQVSDSETTKTFTPVKQKNVLG